VFCISMTTSFPQVMLRWHSHLAYLFLRHCSMLTFLSCSEPITARIVITHSLNYVFRLRKTPLGATYTNCRTQSKYNIHGSVHRNNILIQKSQQEAHVTEFILPDDCSTCFGYHYHPSSGAQNNCNYSI